MDQSGGGGGGTVGAAGTGGAGSACFSGVGAGDDNNNRWFFTPLNTPKMASKQCNYYRLVTGSNPNALMLSLPAQTSGLSGVY